MQWADLCEGMLLEAKWEKTGTGPTTLEGYLRNAWITASGPVLLSHAYHELARESPQDVPRLWEVNNDLIYNSCLIFRLCNDLITSAVNHPTQKGLRSSS